MDDYRYLLNDLLNRHRDAILAAVRDHGYSRTGMYYPEGALARGVHEPLTEFAVHEALTEFAAREGLELAGRGPTWELRPGRP